MKKTLALTAILAGALLATPTTANAGDWSFGVGFGSHGRHVDARYRSGRRHNRGHYREKRGFRNYRHSRGHAYRSHGYWVPPVYRTIVTGYDYCGDPIYRRVVVRRGYYAH